MTDAEILDAAEDFRSQYTHGGTTFDGFDEIGFARAIEAEVRASHGQAPAQPAGPCAICGSDEPFTGTCGSGDPRALCKQPSTSPQAAQQAPAGATDPWQQHMANQAEVIDCEALQRAMVQHGISFPEGGMEYFRASLGEMVNRFVRFAAPAAPSTPGAGGWISIQDQLPPCQDDQDYIGINSAGFAGIFNAIADIAGNVYCMMETAEDSVSIMSDLSIWKPFIRPLPASPTIEGESK